MGAVGDVVQANHLQSRFFAQRRSSRDFVVARSRELLQRRAVGVREQRAKGTVQGSPQEQASVLADGDVVEFQKSSQGVRLTDVRRRVARDVPERVRLDHVLHHFTRQARTSVYVGDMRRA